MEYTIEEYRRSSAKITSSDGFKYFYCNVILGIKLITGWTLFKDRCKGSAKIDQERNLIFSKGPHNHPGGHRF